MVVDQAWRGAAQHPQDAFMHIVLSSRHYPPETGRGGLGTYTYHLAHALVEAGHHVVVVSNSPASTVEELDGRVRVVKFEFRWQHHWFLKRTRNAVRYSFILARTLRKLHRQQPIDVVHFPDLLGEGAAYLMRPGVPVVIRTAMPIGSLEAGNDDSWKRSSLDRIDEWMAAGLESFALRRAHSLVTPSAWMARELTRSHPGLPQPRIVSNGTDLELFRPRPRDEARTNAGIPQDALVYLYAGPLEFRKGVHLLPRAFEIVSRQHPEAMLVIAGGDHLTAPGSGSMRRWLEIQVESREIDERTLFLGTVAADRMPEIYAIADVLVAPTRGEAFGNVIMEALACGLPVITTSEGGQAELVIHGETGVLIPPGNPEALAEGMLGVAEDAETRRAAGRDARTEALARFDRKLMAQRFTAVYREVTDPHELSPADDLASTLPTREPSAIN